ncbi:TetR/AcrR family transcriptional regulator [Actinocorallia sp. A-T 12471]|uniref:TetR/AcrR family transcriptional regulator n=1 Tax=Actinocorallia sp. A-T 12471 TaxID=3089813 RepID=UPI0029D271C4|nr:TetR/AcrR family transcriptional regulator [Actinocorallia sp. A-T 12471]MDX6741978.1 TetR/AcrR family transcriptional regulator [Actinocorallia sp. A-T 12471]
MGRSVPQRIMRVVLTRELIVHTAVELVERAGPDALSMRAVAEELGVSAMATYRHVASKEDLIEGMAEYVMATLDVPDEQEADWRDEARALIRAFREIAREFPRSLALVLESRTRIPVTLRAIERAVALCVRAGLDGPTAIAVMRSIMAFTLGAQLREAGLGRMLARDPGDPAEAVKALGEAEFPHVVAQREALLDADADADFEFGIALFLAAIEAKAAALRDPR